MLQKQISNQVKKRRKRNFTLLMRNFELSKTRLSYYLISFEVAAQPVTPGAATTEAPG